MDFSEQSLPLFQAPLVIVDELGRATSPAEGLGLAHAIAEDILASKATCFFATHFKVRSAISLAT